MRHQIIDMDQELTELNAFQNAIKHKLLLDEKPKHAKNALSLQAVDRFTETEQRVTA
jgi:hypothetical protein